MHAHHAHSPPTSPPATAGEINALWVADPQLHALLRDSDCLETARARLYEHLNRCEISVFSLESPLSHMEKANIRECVRVFQSLIGPVNEQRAGFSCLEVLWTWARQGPEATGDGISKGFVLEFAHLLRGLAGNSGIYDHETSSEELDFLRQSGREAALTRSALLDQMADLADLGMTRYPTGLDPDVVERRAENRERILAHFQGSPSDWTEHAWHLRRIVRHEDTLGKLIDLTPEEHQAVRLCREHGIPFGITPYYVSLMDREPSRKRDHAVRAQVIPPLSYVRTVLERRACSGMKDLDFMGEADTSPIDLVTRRYPKVAIFKPYDTCAQICVYCQRNWELKEALSPTALASPQSMEEASDWLARHAGISDILITGGDPCVLGDSLLDRILGRFSSLPHVHRIRIGTRCPVVLPFRFTDSMVDMVRRHHSPGHVEICLMTHFEHPYEVTPEAAEAIARLREAGVRFYNQAVFTMENSRRFELAALREILWSVGVDPYYTFNAKGKEETLAYRAPIARILQERKEEARLLPGVSRTDEPVFNVPRLGKNHLRAWADHRVIMILPDGSRVYEFHPWEKFLQPVPSYTHRDVPIHDYLLELERRGEDPEDYRTIWYYY